MTRFHCEPVGTTKRQGSTPSKKEAMHTAQGGICPLCDNPMVMGEKLVDEHMRALGLGGSNDPGNRRLVHATCAYEKTFGRNGDAARIAKTKAQKRAGFGFRAAPHRPIQSRPMLKRPPQRSASRDLIKPPLPRLPLYPPA